jgi:hypothetical protein
MENFHYRLGTSYAVVTAILVSFQEPFSALPARSLRSLDFMAFTQLALVFSIPLLILRADSSRDFAAIVFDLKNWPTPSPIVGFTNATLSPAQLALRCCTTAIARIHERWAPKRRWSTVGCAKGQTGAFSLGLSLLLADFESAITIRAIIGRSLERESGLREPLRLPDRGS